MPIDVSAQDNALALTTDKIVKIVFLTREIVKNTVNEDPNNILKAVDDEVLDTTITNIAFNRIRTNLEI